MLFRGSGFRRSQKKVCKGHRHGALWGSMKPSRPPRWLVQIPRLSGGLCFLARKSSLASNDPSHGTLMPTRTLSWGSSILIKGGENTPPLGLFSLGKREALPRDAMDQTDPLGQGGFSKATLPPARRPTRHSSRAIVPPKWTLPWASNKHSNGSHKRFVSPLGIVLQGRSPPAGRPRPGSLSEWTAPSRAEGFSPATWCPPNGILSGLKESLRGLQLESF